MNLIDLQSMARKAGWTQREPPQEGLHHFTKSSLRALVSLDTGVHLSVAHPTRLPKYKEMKMARYELISHDLWLVQVFPPPEFFVNCHPRVLHMWQVEADWRWMQGTI